MYIVNYVRLLNARPRDFLYLLIFLYFLIVQNEEDSSGVHTFSFLLLLQVYLKRNLVKNVCVQNCTCLPWMAVVIAYDSLNDSFRSQLRIYI